MLVIRSFIGCKRRTRNRQIRKRRIRNRWTRNRRIRNRRTRNRRIRNRQTRNRRIRNRQTRNRRIRNRRTRNRRIRNRRTRNRRTRNRRTRNRRTRNRRTRNRRNAKTPSRCILPCQHRLLQRQTWTHPHQIFVIWFSWSVSFSICPASEADQFIFQPLSLKFTNSLLLLKVNNAPLIPS